MVPADFIERMDQLTNSHTLMVGTLLLAATLLLAWVVVSELRRRVQVLSYQFAGASDWDRVSMRASARRRQRKWLHRARSPVDRRRFRCSLKPRSHRFAALPCLSAR